MLESFRPAKDAIPDCNLILPAAWNGNRDAEILVIQRFTVSEAMFIILDSRCSCRVERWADELRSRQQRFLLRRLHATMFVPRTQSKIPLSQDSRTQLCFSTSRHRNMVIVWNSAILCCQIGQFCFVQVGVFQSLHVHGKMTVMFETKNKSAQFVKDADH